MQCTSLTQFLLSAAICILLTTGNLAAQSYLPAVQVGTLVAPEIPEASGFASGRLNQNVLWTHNDAGDINRIFGITTSGDLLATYILQGVAAIDYEDIAIGPGPNPSTPYLFVGDIGDNDGVRASINVLRFPEPTLPPGATGAVIQLDHVESIELVYPDGSWNAETLMVDPWNGDWYIVTKAANLQSRVYRAAYPQSTQATIALEFVDTFFGLRSLAGDISPDGTRIIVRTDNRAFQWTRPWGGTIVAALLTEPEVIPLIFERRGESLAFAPPGTTTGFYTVNEGLNQPIYFYQAVPEPVTSLWSSLGVLLLWIAVGRRAAFGMQ